MIACAFAGAPPPWELVEAWIIDRFKWTLEELDNAPIDRVLRYWKLLNTYDKYVSERSTN